MFFFTGGSDFPDFLYACGNYADHHDAGEAAHWPVFQAAAVNYIRSQPSFSSSNVSLWTDELQQLAAFIFGVTIHYVTDELWEGLTEQLNHAGMIELVDGLNLGMPGKDDKLETIGNQAADFYAPWILNVSNIHPFDRVFPIAALVEIYHQTPEFADHHPGMNFTNVTSASLKECRIVFNLGLWATQEIGPLLFSVWARQLHQVPFIAEHLFDQPLSGIEDMAAMTTLGWNRVAQWMSFGAPPFTKIPPRTKQASQASDEDDRSTFDLLHAMQPFIAHVQTLRKIPRGAVQQYFQWMNGGVEGNPLFKYVGPDEHRLVLPKLLQTFAYHRVGMNIEMVAQEDEQEKEQEYEQVQEQEQDALNDVKWKEKIVKDKVFTLYGDRAVSYTGSQTVVGDFNGDGNQDMCVSAYGTGTKGNTSQQGAVHCYYNWSSTPNVSPTSSNIESTSNVTIHGDGYRSRFGYALLTLDYNLDGIDDLVVSAPGFSGFDIHVSNSTPYIGSDHPSFHLFGRIYILFGKKHHVFPTTVAGNTTTHISTTVPLRGLGQTLSKGDLNADGCDDLLIGAPLDHHGSGSVFGFISRSTNISSITKSKDTSEADLTLSSPTSSRNNSNVSDMAWYGYSAVVVQDVLFVGAPFYKTKEQHKNTSVVLTVGAVHSYQLATSKRKTSAKYMSTIVGVENLSQFGYGMMSIINDSFVAVSAPDAGAMSNLVKWSARSGMVVILDVSRVSLLSGVHSIKDVHVATVRGAKPYGRFGLQMNTVAAASSRSKSTSNNAQAIQHVLFVSAPFEDTNTFMFGKREMGAVYGFKLADLVRSNNSTTSAAFWSSVGTRSSARYGSSLLAVSKGDQGGDIVVAIGSPLADVKGKERVGVVDYVQVSEV